MLIILTTSKIGVDDRFNYVLWLKQILFNVNIFIWRLFLNRLATEWIFLGQTFWISIILCVQLLVAWWRIMTICFLLVLSTFWYQTLTFDITLARFFYGSSCLVNWTFYSVWRSWSFFLHKITKNLKKIMNFNKLILILKTFVTTIRGLTMVQTWLTKQFKTLFIIF